MGNIKIIKGVFDTYLELEHASVTAGFPSPTDEYRPAGQALRNYVENRRI